MNPLTNIKNVQKMNQRELDLGLIGKKSWHDQYKDSAWIFIGGLPYDLTEGDVIAVFSQYGELVNINLVRDGKTGKSKGFCFLCYEDQRSTVLAVDNLNGIKLLGRTIRVDHVEKYKVPKEHGDEDEVTMKLRKEGIAPKVEEEEEDSEEEDDYVVPLKKHKKDKKAKKKKKHKKKQKETSDSESDSSKKISEKKDSVQTGVVKKQSNKKLRNDEREQAAINTSKSRDYRERSPEGHRESGGDRDQRFTQGGYREREGDSRYTHGGHRERERDEKYRDRDDRDERYRERDRDDKYRDRNDKYRDRDDKYRERDKDSFPKRSRPEQDTSPPRDRGRDNYRDRHR